MLFYTAFVDHIQKRFQAFQLSQFLACCPAVPDWINLSRFLYSSPKKFSYLHNFSSAVQNHKFIVNYIYLVVHNLNSIKSITNSFELSKNAILRTFESNVRLLLRESYIRFDYKQQETCSETFIRTFFFWKH